MPCLSLPYLPLPSTHQNTGLHRTAGAVAL